MEMQRMARLINAFSKKGGAYKLPIIYGLRITIFVGLTKRCV
jgi:hypothetical protein